jgi:hypothetical protein
MLRRSGLLSSPSLPGRDEALVLQGEDGDSLFLVRHH